MAATCDCDAKFSICRKFGWLHNRVLLHLQAELARLEYDLEWIDAAQAERQEFKATHATSPTEKKCLQKSGRSSQDTTTLSSGFERKTQ